MIGGPVLLMYHGVGEVAPHGEEHYTLSDDGFAAHLRWLAERATVVPLFAILDGTAPRDAVAITFDDGEASVATRALPGLAARGLTATVFVTTGWIGTPGYLSADQIRELHRSGWTIGSHTVTHAYLSDLALPELERELRGSREALSDILGAPPLHLSLPGGRESRRVLAAARRAGYRSVCTSRVGLNPLPVDPYRLRRLMVLRGCGAQWLGRAVRRDPRLYLALIGRQELLGGAKRLLGNRRYEQLRAAAFRLLGREARQR